MAEFGRAALTIAGSFFGPWGTLAGSFLGSLLFPVEGPKGPRLNELNVQHSTVGAPIPIVYGTAVLAGNVIWSGGLIETTHEGGGGKGGPSGPTTYSYSVDVAVGISEPITGVRRIWADADLIYDASTDEDLEARLILQGVSAGDIADAIIQVRALSAQTFQKFVLYLGDEDQLPDPTIESYEGVGLTPSYRGLAYIVWTGFELERFGNRIPNFRFEVSAAPAAQDCTAYANYILTPWNDGATRDPRSSAGAYEYDGGGGFKPTLAAAINDLDPNLLPTPVGWSDDTDNTMMMPPCISISTENVVLFLMLNYLTVTTIHCELDAVEELSFACGTVHSMGECTAFYWQGKYASQPDADQFHGFWGYETPDCTEAEIFGGYTQPGTGDCGGGNFVQYLTDRHVSIRRTLQEPETCSPGATAIPGTNYCVFPDGSYEVGHTWTLTSGTFKALSAYDTSGNVVTAYPLNPVLPSTDPNYNVQAYWEAAYAQAIADGEPIAGGLVYGVDYPVVMSSAFVGSCDTEVVTPECVPMATIVADICRRAGLRTDTSTQIDVSDLTTCVPGYIVGRQMSARDALGPLRMFGLWDAVESDVLTFVERGHALVATITDDDLGAHEHGSQPPPKVEVSRTQEKELPRRLRLHFPDLLHDHEVSEQTASRITTEAIDEVDVDLPISMEPDTAKQLAEITLYESWVSRNGYRISLNNDWLALEPTDCIEIPVDGQTERVRITAANYKIGGIIEIEGVRDDGDGYVSTAVATPGTPSGGVPGSSGGGPLCDSAAVLLDIPCITGTPPAGEMWIYAAVYGVCSWTCAELFRSSDGGETYRSVARTDQEATVGTIVDITGPATDPTLPGDSPQYDTSNVITVQLLAGTLSSVSDAGIAAGENTAAIGINGRWVIVQFKTATLTTADTYELTDLIWGLNDTEHLLYTTVAGDTFVLLSNSALLRISETPDAIGLEKQYKVVSCGQSIDAVDESTFTTWGLCYQRNCPSTVLSATVTTPPSGAADGDAYFLPNDTSLTDEWANHAGEIATWSDETDSWVFCAPSSGSVIIIEDDPGGPVIAPGGGGTPIPAPWTPAIPPLPVMDSADMDTSYFVAWTGTEYVKVLGNDLAGGGASAASDVSFIPTSPLSSTNVQDAIDELSAIVEDIETDLTLGTVVNAYQAADVQSTSNASLTSTSLAVALTPGTWYLEAHIVSTAHAAPDFQVRYNFDGSFASSTILIVTKIGSGGGNAAAIFNNLNSTFLLYNATNPNTEMVTGTIEVTASGTLTYQFSQQTNSPGNPITVHRGSFLRCTRVA